MKTKEVTSLKDVKSLKSVPMGSWQHDILYDEEEVLAFEFDDGLWAMIDPETLAFV